MSLPPEAT